AYYLHAGPVTVRKSCKESLQVEKVLADPGFSVGDPKFLGALVRRGEQAADTPCDSVLRQLRRGELAELLERCVTVLKTQPAGLLQVIGHLIPEDLEGSLDTGTSGHGGLRATTQVRVIEVGEAI